MRLATRLPGERALAAGDADEIAAIRAKIIEAGDRWRQRHPFLARHQDAVGLTICLVSVVGVVADAVLYAEGLMPWWLVVPVTAFWLSVLHELEHDLLHSMYFRRKPLVHNGMLGVGWLLRPSTINPWIRRRMHLHHHEVSGTDSDMEERALTNGEGWGAHRLLSLADAMLGMYTKPMRMRRLVRDYVRQTATSKEQAQELIRDSRMSYVPLGLVHYMLWHLFLVVGFVELCGAHLEHDSAYQALSFVAVTLLAPNALRTFCLHFVSSNMHYYGDVEAHNVLEQTQVWTAKRFWPAHAFCFNFGETHAIHHFLVRDPFYIREAIKSECHVVLREHGVRFNDFGTFRRANRFSLGIAGGEA